MLLRVRAKEGVEILRRRERPVRYSSSVNQLLEFFRDFFGFLRERKKFWLLPVFAILLVMGLLVFLTHGSAVAPLLYTIF